MALTSHLVPAYLFLCILLGGASLAGFAANLVLQLLALPILVWSFARTVPGQPAPARSLQWLALAIAGVMALQLVPLPPEIWTNLPGRERVAEGFAMIGEPLPWLSWSLAPGNTLGALLWLLPAAAVLFGMIRAGAYRADTLAWWVVAATLLSVLLGAVQITGGASNPFYFYSVTNRGSAVGPFANANHMATLLLISIPFLFAIIGRARSKGWSRKQSSTVAMCIAMLAVVAVGLGISTSLAGIGLAIPVTLASLLLLRRKPRVPIWGLALVGLLSAGATAAIFTLPFDNNLFGGSAERPDSRATSISTTLDAAGDNLPLGSGFGTFADVYRTYEDPETVQWNWMNHAHSDYAEILLEGGVPAALLVILFLLWWGWRTRILWSTRERGEAMARAASIASAAVLLHSLVDYPLRTAAISALFAACLALMSGSREAGARRSQESGDAHHLSA